MTQQSYDVPGTVEAVHEIDGITVVEHYDSQGLPHFRVFVDSEDTGIAVPALEMAIVYGIAYRHEGPETEADMYFFRMIGAERDA